MDLNAEDKKRLAKDQNITKNAIVTIEQDGGEFDWWETVGKYGPGSLWVATSSGGQSLSITVQYTAADERYKGYTAGINLSCQDDRLKINRGSGGVRLYSESTRLGTSGKYDVVNKSYEMKVTLSLEECEVKEEKAECSLNVVTKIN